MLTTILGTVLIALLAVVALVYPRRLSSLLPLFFPLVLIRFNIGSIPFSFFEVLIWVLLLGVLIHERFFLGEKGRLKEVGKLFYKYPPLLGVTVFLVIATATLAFTPQTLSFNTGIASALWEVFETFKTAIGIWKGWIIPLFLYVFIVSFYTQIKKDESFMVVQKYSYIASAVMVVVVGMVLQYGLQATTTLDGRLGGLFVSANYLVFYAAPALLLSLTDGLRSVRTHGLTKKTLLLAVGSLLLAVGLLFTRSYASWISLAIACGIWLWMSTTARQRVILGLVVLVLGAGIIYKEKDSPKFKAFTEITEQSSTSTRVEVYTISTELLKEHWLTGVGMGAYEAVYKTEAVRILGKQPYEWVMLHPHNLYLSWWLFTGIFGFITMLVLSVTTLWHGFKKYSLAVFPFLYILLHGFVDTPFWKLDAMLIFFLVILLVWQKKEEKE